MKILMYFKRNKTAGIIVVISVIMCGVLVLENWNDSTFFSANVIDILTFVLGIIIAVYLTENFTDRRRRNDCIEHIVIEIESFVSDDNNFIICDQVLMKQASCANRIKYLKDASFKDIKEEIDFISQNYEVIRDLYSNHNNSQQELDTVTIDINKRRQNIVDKCCKIRIGLYD